MCSCSLSVFTEDYPPIREEDALAKWASDPANTAWMESKEWHTLQSYCLCLFVCFCVLFFFVISMEITLLLFKYTRTVAAFRVFFSFLLTQLNSQTLPSPVLLRKQSLGCFPLRAPPHCVLLLCERLLHCDVTNRVLINTKRMLQIQMRWFMMTCPEKTLTPTQVCDLFFLLFFFFS